MKRVKPKRWRKGIMAGVILSFLFGMVVVMPLCAYQITKGDTLWDLSEKFLKDPFLWPKVWALNPYISNPHWIFPGNRLRFKGQPSRSAEPAVMPSSSEPRAAQRVSKEPAVPPKPAPPVLTHENIHAEGFIAESKLKEVGKVLTNEDDTPMNSEPNILCFYTRKGETVYPGDRLTTFTYVKTVYHPETEEKLGYLVELGGEIEVFRVEGRVCFARILHSYMEINEGDPVGRFDRWPSKLVLTPFRKPLEAYIVMVKEGLMMTAQDRIVYLDKGSEDGLRPGNVLNIYKTCPPKDNPYETHYFRCSEKIEMPDRKVGTLVILSTRLHTATAMIYESQREVRVGDTVRP